VALLDAVAGPLGEMSSEILRRCLLYRSAEGFVLHETLRRDVRGPEDEAMEQPRAQLRDLAEHYASVRIEEEGRDSGAALLSAMEAFYYAARSGAADMLAQGAFFVDQLDLLGKSLSYDFGDFEGAVAIFRRALQLDERDDYAHHYLAYNLERCGSEAAPIEQHYRRAIEINPRHTWWRARYVRFLVSRGRTRDARVEWDAASDELGLPDAEGSVRLYETLHGWVARALLERGQLDFAEAVLADVPHRARVESPSLTALIRRLRALEIAESEGAFVPSEHLAEPWWIEGPFLLQRRIGEGNTDVILRRWLAARIEAIDHDEVELRVRDVEVGELDPPPSGRVRMDRATFDALNRDGPSVDLAPGRFIEVGLYSQEDGSDVRRLIRVHALRAWVDETLPAPFPVPQAHGEPA
jgi:tetratricopeptide (TPR) repeat protein